MWESEYRLRFMKDTVFSVWDKHDKILERDKEKERFRFLQSQVYEFFYLIGGLGQNQALACARKLDNVCSYYFPICRCGISFSFFPPFYLRCFWNIPFSTLYSTLIFGTLSWIFFSLIYVIFCFDYGFMHLVTGHGFFFFFWTWTSYHISYLLQSDRRTRF